MEITKQIYKGFFRFTDSMKGALIEMKKIFENIITWLFYIQLKGIKIISKKALYGPCVRSFCRAFEKNSPYYVTLNFRPKKAERLISIEKESQNASKFAIIMQGPLIEKDEFTLETVKVYNKLFPGVCIIISTWESENGEYIKKISKCENVSIVLSKMPSFSGKNNFNYQLYSTRRGLEQARKLGKSYVLKSRNDYRITKRGLMEYLYNLLETFPVTGHEISLKKRIVIINGGLSSMLKPYYVGDQVNFGHIDDMDTLWNIDFLNENLKSEEFYSWLKREHVTWVDERKETSMLCKPLILNNTGREAEFTNQAYWSLMKDYFITISAKDINVYWIKYDSKYEETLWDGDYCRNDSDDVCYCYNWTISEWINLYYGSLRYDEMIEKYLYNKN